MARGKRTRLATGIYEDAFGRAVIVKVKGVQHERRYAPGTTLETLRRERKALAQEKRGHAAPSTEGTLEADVSAYLDTLPAKSTVRRNATTDLAHWVSAGFGARARQDLTPTQIRGQLSRWAEAGIAASTINHRRQALLSLYRALDGRSAANPVRDVPRIREPRPQPRGIPLTLVRDILAQLPDRGRAVKGADRPDASQTKARLWVMALTGFPQAQLMRLTRKDVNWHAKTVYVGARLKGHGATGRTLPLTDQALFAFKQMDACHAWGPFSTRSMAYSFARAVKKAKAIYAGEKRHWSAPPNLRAYDLRHAYLTEVYRRTRDLRATAELGLHADMRTTARYAEAAVTDTARAARDSVAKSWKGLAPKMAPRQNMKKYAR